MRIPSEMFTKCCVLLAIFVKGAVSDSDACLTPNGRDGDCVPLESCPPLLDLSKDGLSLEESKTLNQHHCGYEGMASKVCCPKKDKLPDQNCGGSTQSRIFGGQKTGLDEFPWLVLLQYRESPDHNKLSCGGALITNRYVLTAAHCAKTKLLESVRVGEHDRTTDPDCVTNNITKTVECAPPFRDIPIDQKFIHEDYQLVDKYNDIALLRLKEEITFTDYVKPICLPSKSEEFTKDYLDERLFSAGWGATENNSESSNVKLKVQLPVKDFNYCEARYRRFNLVLKLKDTQLCVGGEKGRDSCNGDSGGPLMTVRRDKKTGTQWYAVGIVSFGNMPCGVQDWGAIYTRVSKFVDWINHKISSI